MDPIIKVIKLYRDLIAKYHSRNTRIFSNEQLSLTRKLFRIELNNRTEMNSFYFTVTTMHHKSCDSSSDEKKDCNFIEICISERTNAVSTLSHTSPEKHTASEILC